MKATYFMVVSLTFFQTITGLIRLFIQNRSLGLLALLLIALSGYLPFYLKTKNS